MRYAYLGTQPFPDHYESHAELPQRVRQPLRFQLEAMEAWRRAYNAVAEHVGPGVEADEAAWQTAPPSLLAEYEAYRIAEDERKRVDDERRRAEWEPIFEQQRLERERWAIEHRQQKIRTVGELRDYTKALTDDTRILVSNSEGYNYTEEPAVHVDEDDEGPFLYIDGE